MREKTHIIDYIAAGGDRERRAKLAVALEIEENLHALKFALREELMRAVFGAVRMALEPDFTVVDHGLVHGDPSGFLVVFRETWRASGLQDWGILSCALGVERPGIRNLFLGAVKEPPGMVLDRRDLIEPARKIIRVFRKTFGEGKVARGRWLVYRNLAPPYGAMTSREFYLQIITDRGFRRAVGELAETVIQLVDVLSPSIDEFMEIYGRETRFSGQSEKISDERGF